MSSKTKSTYSLSDGTLSLLKDYARYGYASMSAMIEAAVAERCAGSGDGKVDAIKMQEFMQREFEKLFAGREPAFILKAEMEIREGFREKFDSIEERLTFVEEWQIDRQQRDPSS